MGLLVVELDILVVQAGMGVQEGIGRLLQLPRLGLLMNPSSVVVDMTPVLLGRIQGRGYPVALELGGEVLGFQVDRGD